MSVNFAMLALITVAGAVAAMSLRNLIHCALALTVAFAGLAAIYLQLGAQFVGFAQVLVYIGAVAILIMFAMLLTRGSDAPSEPILGGSLAAGIAVAAMVFIILATTVSRSSIRFPRADSPPQATVQQLGEQLMTKYLLPLEVSGLLLTAALIGAVIIAMQETKTK